LAANRRNVDCCNSIIIFLSDKNLAIANRTRVSCAQNSLRRGHRPNYRVILKFKLRVIQDQWKRNH